MFFLIRMKIAPKRNMTAIQTYTELSKSIELSNAQVRLTTCPSRDKHLNIDRILVISVSYLEKAMFEGVDRSLNRRQRFQSYRYALC